ncbi:DNA/RNA non-specific endonuclease [Verrucomicrobium sp. BvORR034]|uniref:DNA/RNA non-specific endonuclease n=1 Tax=Verrucomicrobium sp. BvORR034 TaxID=1396418 RepID=UPI000678B5D2|nr:DNA/RNA non-specific endonuclease [Verrucomicrobium sp. BvORR034]
MSDTDFSKRLESVRESLGHLFGSNVLSGGGGSEIREAASGLPVLDAELANLAEAADPTRATEGKVTALEAIIEKFGRPVAFIKNGEFEDLPAPWTHFNVGEIRHYLEGAIPSVGRVELISPGGRTTVHLGSGFVVGEGLLMTNRHVAQLFVTGVGSGSRLAFVPGRTGAIDFGREAGFDKFNLAGTLRLTGVKMVHPYWDMALLQMDGMPVGMKALTLSTKAPDDLLGRDIAVMGYPGRGNDRRPEAVALEAELYGDVFGVKRMAPGRVKKRSIIESFANAVSAMEHDASTLAGNSGSAIFEALTGHVVGLHFAGITLRANYSVPTFELARDQRVWDAGVQFSGVVSTQNEWEPLWEFAGAFKGSGGKPRPRPVPASVPGGGPGGGGGGGSVPAASLGGDTATWTIPLTISVRVGGGGMPPVVEAGSGGTPIPLPGDAGEEVVTALESFQIPIMYDGLDTREGYKADFLNLTDGDVPLPVLTAKGEKAVVVPESGSAELKYHHFSVFMHKKRRLALFTAANVDWRKASRLVNGKKPTRKELTGLAEGVSEQWVTDDRIKETEQLPDVFFTKDNKAFDKGHLVRRDDVAWGKDFEDMQIANGDTYLTTNCSPQVKEYNQASHGDYNWGELESMIERETKAEKVIIFSGPILDPQDRFFTGLTETGPTKVQIPQRFWKIVVARKDADALAYGFILDQDLKKVPLTEKFEEFVVEEDWKRFQVPIELIEDYLYGLVKLDWCKKRDAFET